MISSPPDFEDSRLSDLADLVRQLVAGNLAARCIPSAKGDKTDEVMAGLNILAEELSHFLKESEESNQRFKALTEATFEAVALSENNIIFDANSNYLKLFKCELDEVKGKKIDEFISIESRDEIKKMLISQMKAKGEAAYEGTLLRKDGSLFFAEVRAKMMPYQGRQIRVAAIKDITERKQAETILLENARQVGRAEFATGILHNVGNVVNSINVSTENMQKILNDSSVKALLKGNDLLKINISRLADFFSKDPKGNALAQYYLQVGEVAKNELDALLKETAELKKRVTVVKDIIATQQGYAKSGQSPTEKLSLVNIINDALSIQLSSLERQGIAVVKEFETIEPIMAQRTQLIHVFINFFKNAQEAMKTKGPAHRRLTIQVTRDGRNIVARVTDAGDGISKENMAKMFSHGFTTKVDGHGFGLHSCAGAVREMGGEISVHSDGVDKGATFTLSFKAAADILSSAS